MVNYEPLQLLLSAKELLCSEEMPVDNQRQNLLPNSLEKRAATKSARN